MRNIGIFIALAASVAALIIALATTRQRDNAVHEVGGFA